MVKTSCYLALLGFLLISPSSNAAESPVYVKITEVIRSVTLLDEAGAIIGKRFEKKDTNTLYWYEAHKLDNSWQWTNKGSSDREAAATELRDSAGSGAC